MNAFRNSLTFLKKTKSKRNATELHWVYEKSLTDLSYRLPASACNDIWIGFKEFYRILKRKKYIPELTHSEHLILVSTANQTKIAVNYVSSNLKSDGPINAIVREELKTSISAPYLLFSLGIALKCFWSKNRLNLALQIREVMEWTSILEVCRKYNIQSFIDFTPFEKDANLLALLLQENGFSVMKIPSPGPLGAHHTHLIANTVVCSSAYHLEEIEHFTNWQYQNILQWPPDQYHMYAHVYQNANASLKNTIAFYSHGEWVRRAEGHADPGLGILENELFILKELNHFLSSNKHISLVIYPHPKERMREDLMNHYSSLLPNSSFSIFDGKLPTAWNFHNEDVAIMAYSTLLFERLCLGFKTLFVSTQASTFPLKSSPLQNICIQSKEEFEYKLKHALKESQNDFFKNNQLNSYELSNFLKPKSGQD